MWSKLKQRFPNADHFIFKETNMQYLGQLNALAEIQGLTSLFIDPKGNPITEKKWESYAIYRLSHWGLRVINQKEVSVNLPFSHLKALVAKLLSIYWLSRKQNKIENGRPLTVSCHS